MLFRSHDPHKVALELRDINSGVVGYQVRNLLPTAKPKYITRFYKNTTDVAWFLGNKETLVITEDYLSSYRTHQDTGYSCIALLRTSLTDKTLMQISDLNFKQVYIWLDPDEAGIKGANKVSKTLRHFLPTKTKIFTVRSMKEPKECSPKELKETFT